MTETFKLNIGSAKLACDRSGIGKPLIFLHAGVADKCMWHNRMADLSDSYQIIACDRRGFGETITTDEAFSHVEDLRKLLDKLEVSTTFLVGCSQGGRIAIDFTLAYPQRVTKLVLISPAISGAPEIQATIEGLEEACIVSKQLVLQALKFRQPNFFKGGL